MSKDPLILGHFKNGAPITQATVDTLVEQAERGFDPAAMRPRRVGRPRLGDEPSREAPAAAGAGADEEGSGRSCATGTHRQRRRPRPHRQGACFELVSA